DLECGGEFVKLRLKSEADIDRPVPAHSATGRLVGEHAIAVVLNSGDVVKGSQQRAGIKNGHDAVRTVRATILYDAGFHGGDTAVALNCGFQIDNGARTPAVGPENFLARVGDFHRRARFRAATAAIISSGITSLLPPNPPPTSGLITRICDIGISRTSESLCCR